MSPEQRPSPCILVVDDEQAIAWTLGLILEREGHNAKHFCNPEHLLRFSERCTPDIVIADVMMPEMTGIELAAELTRRHPNCKIILFSGQAETSELLGIALKQGQYLDVISKPLSPSSLLRQIDQHVRSARAVDNKLEPIRPL